ncbi:MAG TPA: hypothetical protein VJW20_10610 [Candidatus Angelobacter sp.]|nr:hypothetical protein [Candidatus Angelobacter sp.]
MTDDNDKDVEQTFHYESGLPVLDVQNEAQRKANADKQREEQYKQAQLDLNRQQLMVNKRLAWFTFALFVCTLLTGGISLWQASIAKESASAAKAGAKAAQAAITETQKMRTQNEKSFNATVEQFRLDQRAWLGPNIIALVNPPIEANKEIQIGVNYTNSGKTPALDVGGFTGRTFVVSSARLDFSKFHPKEKMLKNTMFPGSSGHFLATINGLPKPVFDDLIAGNSRIYVYGMISYRDIFKREHWTHFCSWYSPEAKGFMSCDTFNEVDSNDM